MTYCTEFYLKKKNHSSKLLLVNSHSFTSLKIPCSNLLGFSSFWLHCTGTRFWNQEKKKSMDVQLVSHSPEGHRLPSHFSKLTPEWKAPESRISPAPGLTPEQRWQPRASLTLAGPELLCGHQRPQLHISASRTQQPLKEEPKICNCPLGAVPHTAQGSHIPGGSTAMEVVPHNHCRGVLEPAMPVNDPVVWALRESLENKALQCTPSHRNTADAKRHKRWHLQGHGDSRWHVQSTYQGTKFPF